MFSAFQGNAFQLNAYQIVALSSTRDQGAGRGSGRKPRHLNHKDIWELRRDYERAFEEKIPEEVQIEIIEATKPFRKESALNGGVFIPEINQIDFDALYRDSNSLNRLGYAIEQFRLWEEEEFCLLLLLAD